MCELKELIYTDIQAGLFLHDIVLCDFALTQLENLHTFQIYVKMFGLTRFGIDNTR
jgi:hypothetical protein